MIKKYRNRILYTALALLLFGLLWWILTKEHPPAYLAALAAIIGNAIWSYIEKANAAVQKPVPVTHEENIHLPFIQNTKRRNIDNLFFHETSLAGESISLKQKVINLLNKSTDSQVTVLQGMPGLGKSYLAQEIANHFCGADGKERFDTIWWIDADKMSSKSNEPEVNVSEDVKELAGELSGEIIVNLQQTGWLKEFFRGLRDKRKFLLIYDNACDGTKISEFTPSEFAKHYFPETKNENQQIIVTSRSEKWIRDFQKIIKLEEWSIKDYESFFNHFQINTEDKNALIKIHGLFDGLVLAAAIAVAYLAEHQYKSLADYADNLKTEQGLKRFIETEPELKNYPNSLFNAVLLSYNALNGDAKNLLHQLVLMSPDEIPLISIHTNLKSNKISKNNPFNEEFRFEKAYKELEKAALIKQVSKTEYDYSIHRLIQFSLRLKLVLEKKLPEAADEVVEIFDSTTDKFKSDKYEYYKKILPQIESFAEFLSSYLHKQDKSVLSKDIDDTLKTLLRNAGKYCFEVGNVAMALRLFNYALVFSKGNHHLIQQINLDKSYGLLLRDENEEAIGLAKGALDYYRNEYNGSDKIKWIIESQNKLAKIFQRKGEFESAEISIDECLAELLADGSEDLTKEKTSGLLHDKATICWDKGIDQNKAIEIFEESINFKKSVLKANDADLYLNISRMIKGVAHVLNGEYQLQKENHEAAFKCFSNIKDKEYRRYSYTAFYLLHFAWDELGWKQRDEAKANPDLDEYLKQYCLNEKILEGDIKYMIIKSIVGLRVAVRKDDQPEAGAHYNNLMELLDKKKHTSRYIDDGTVAVSAILDYGLYLKDKNLDSAEVLKKVNEMLQYHDKNGNLLPIQYHRRNELEDACK